MKILVHPHHRLALALAVLAPAVLNAAVLTVSSGNVAAQYNDINTAINAANNGDTLYISAGTYSSFGLSKPLTLIGEGAWPVDGGPSAAVGSAGFYDGAEGSMVIGLHFTSSVYVYATGITMERCRFSSGSSIYMGMSGSDAQFILRHSYVAMNFSVNNKGGVSLFNNIFMPMGNGYQMITSSNQGTVLIQNNVFVAPPDHTSSYSLSSVSNAVVENNIFYGAGTQFTSVTGCLFNNNLSWQVPNITAWPPAGNVGSGNLLETDPQFVNTPDAVLSNLYDYAIQSGSPADNAGTDGTDIGIMGGAMPWVNYAGHPRLPRVTALTLPASVVQLGNDLDPVQADGTKVD